MAGETTLTLIGNLTDDPELRYTPSGAAVASFTVASTPRTYETTHGDKRTITELLVDDIGPSLRYTTAKPNKTQRSNEEHGEATS